MSNDSLHPDSESENLDFIDRDGYWADEYEEAVRHGLPTTTQDKIFKPGVFTAVGNQAGREWARTRATSSQLKRLAWFSAATQYAKGGVDSRYPWFVFAIHPEHGRDGTRRYWRTMWEGLESVRRVGYDPAADEWADFFTRGFYLGASHIAVSKMGFPGPQPPEPLGVEDDGLDEILGEEPAGQEPAGQDLTEEMLEIVSDFEWEEGGNESDYQLGRQYGTEWASNRADSEELRHLSLFDEMYYVEDLFDWTTGEVLGKLFTALFVFLATPPTPDPVPYYPDVWLQMVGHRVENPWKLRFARGFVSAALEAVRQRSPDQRSES